ncbi:makorin-like protein [Plasmopara halstedii]|uniref:Makorin-like protein n=1 Tax=Plasmopara halstedii TaxID=4781 RepID=A0A0P1AX59_PLAHL|nr:makorin-like protein [Plasmopara halstedii]CEG45208.1 makorin-like protein [Plasmopara halstedii]|eukprot:XP_024581577.1 makorin-like protein [Plasmopara halstedii]
MRRSSHFLPHATVRSPSSERESVMGNSQTQESNKYASGSDEEKCSVSPERSKGESVVLAPTTALCRFFVLGKCRYGSHCTFSHALPSPASECTEDETEILSAAAALVECPFFLRGNCKYGDYCRLNHNSFIIQGAESESMNRFALKAGKEGSSAHLNSVAAVCADNTTRGGNQRDFTCGICFDDIVQSGKHFGLLNCDHCFCLECLRSWRQSKNMELEVIRACPACRLPSDFIVPSLIFVTGEKKLKVTKVYKSHLALRECKYFTGSFGSCPFGPRCFYAHRDTEGRDVKHLDRPKRSTKSRHVRHDREGEDAAFQSLLQQYIHLFRFFGVADSDDIDLAGGLFHSDDSDDDSFELDFLDSASDTE